MTINNVLIIDDHPIFLDGLSKVITSIYPSVNILTAKSCLDAKNVIDNTVSLDCIFLDYNLPDSNGIAFIEEIKKIKKIMPVVMLTSESDIALIHKAFEAGAAGFLIKSSTTEDYKRCMEAVCNGENYIDIELSYTLKHYRKTQLVILNSFNEQISKRKKDILFMLKKGLSNKEISDLLHVSQRTVKLELTELYIIFDVENRNRCVSEAMKIGII